MPRLADKIVDTVKLIVKERTLGKNGKDKEDTQAVHGWIMTVRCHSDSVLNGSGGG